MGGFGGMGGGAGGGAGGMGGGHGHAHGDDDDDEEDEERDPNDEGESWFAGGERRFVVDIFRLAARCTLMSGLAG